MAKNVIIGFGNPLLDITVRIDDNHLLNKYKIKPDDQKELTLSEFQSLQEDIARFDQTFSAGGSAQNTLRVLQWLLRKEEKCVIVGSTGEDEGKRKLKELMETEGVIAEYVDHPGQQTGSTIALVNNKNRALLAYLGAAENMTINDLQKNPKIAGLLQTAKIIYIEGFFTTNNRIEVVKFLVEHCNENNILLVVNISACYLVEKYGECIKFLVENGDVVFGNKREYSALAKYMSFSDELQLGIYLSRKQTSGKAISIPSKIVVITNDCREVVNISNGEIAKFDVPVIDLKNVKDTTGAGDSFVAGYIAGLIRSKNCEFCTELGCYAASKIIQQIGCSLPHYAPKIS